MPEVATIPTNISKDQAIAGWAAERMARLRQRKASMAKYAKESGMQTRAENVAKHVAVAAAAATLPAWLFTRNRDWRYLDEEQTIETEAVVAGGLLLIGAGVYIAKPDLAGADLLMTAGLAAGSSYLGAVVRRKAELENAEEDALLAQGQGTGGQTQQQTAQFQFARAA